MITAILDHIVQEEGFSELTVNNVIAQYPELLDPKYWPLMDEWKNKQVGQQYNRALFLLSQIVKITRLQDKHKPDNPFEEDMRNLSRTHINAAVDYYDQQDFGNMVYEYLEAFSIDIKLMDHYRVKEVLTRILDILPILNISSANSILAKIAGNAFALETFQSGIINKIVLQIYQGILRIYVSHQPINVEAFILLVQHAKGFSFGALLRRSQGLPDPTTYAVKLLEELQELEAQQLQLNEPIAIKSIDEEMLMSAYLGEVNNPEEDSLNDKIKLRQILFDRWLTIESLNNIEKGEYPLLSLDAIKASLQDNAVLYIQFMGGDPQGFAANYILLITKEWAGATYAVDKSVPSGKLNISDGAISMDSAILSFNVPEVRKEIMNEPEGNTNCSDKALQLLKGESELLLDPILPYLDELKSAGKNTLIFQPHGAYHYFPFHLLPYKEGILCDEWLVTLLPNLHLLTSASNIPPSSSYVEMASFGLSYNNLSAYGYAPLNNAIAEAEAVAKLFGVTALTDENGSATQNNFLEACTISKRVHLCSHALHNVSAPAFEKIFFMPLNNNDGSLAAWELANLDASHLGLLTLSACETALGRFDLMDNLHGLPAIFFKAGVSTIIGTLWEAETYSCETFFVSLYTHIIQGKSKKESFYLAQKQTRQKHPEYRDWGNFFYLGQ